MVHLGSLLFGAHLGPISYLFGTHWGPFGVIRFLAHLGPVLALAPIPFGGGGQYCEQMCRREFADGLAHNVCFAKPASAGGKLLCARGTAVCLSFDINWLRPFSTLDEPPIGPHKQIEVRDFILRAPILIDCLRC